MFGFGKLNLAVIGTGYMAGVMSDSLGSAGGVRPYAVVSRDVENAVAFGREHGYKKAYDSIEEMLSDKKVDLVYVATPASEHYEAVRLCIEYAKPVLCETPLTLTAAKAEELFSLASSQNVLLVEAMYTRFLPLYQQIVNVMSSKVIGEPVMLNASIASDIGNIPRLQRPELGGGALGDLGIYLLNFASMVFGDDVKRIHSSCVFADTGVDRQDSITLQYRDGKMAVLSCTMNGNGESRAVIQGTKGCLVVEDVRNFETVTVFNSSRQKTATYKRPKQKTGYEYELKAFIAALKSNWLECPEMPHSQTSSILHMTDYIRRQLNISYAPVHAVPLPEALADEQDQLDDQSTKADQTVSETDSMNDETLEQGSDGGSEDTAEQGSAIEAEDTAEKESDGVNGENEGQDEMTAGSEDTAEQESDGVGSENEGREEITAGSGDAAEAESDVSEETV